MCFLKCVTSPEQSVSLDEFMQNGDQQTESDGNYLYPCAQKYLNPVWTKQQQMLVYLFKFLQKNNSLIRGMEKTLMNVSQNLENNTIQTVKSEQQNTLQCQDSLKIQEVSQSLPYQHIPLCNRLFGQHKYKYYLQLTQQFPNIIYKQRNFNLFLQLVDQNNNITRNSNIISLFCAVSTNNATWIHQNRVGEPFMKGKTQVKLYKGEASFVKLYARDVSRVYPEGMVNLVIYSKPSALLYTGSNSYQVIINSKQVQPLIIQKVVIRAKKKQ